MNRHYILALLDDTVKTVSCKFRDGFKPYTYKTRLALAAGDRVVVDTPSNGLQVCEVTQVHDLPEMDPNSSTDYKWIICKVDMESYEANLASDTNKFKSIHTARIAAHRQQVRAALVAELPFLEAMAAQSNTLPTTQPVVMSGQTFASNHATAEQQGFMWQEQGGVPEDNPYKDGTSQSAQWIAGYRSAIKQAHAPKGPGMATGQA